MFGRHPSSRNYHRRLSANNPNVFYELGLAHALGKDANHPKREDSKLRADFRGELHFEYTRGDYEEARHGLQIELEKWKQQRKVSEVA